MRISFRLPRRPERSYAFVPQITTAPNFRDRSITFGTAVRRPLIGASEILFMRLPEPLERELAVQVEYDMDEQGMPVP